MRRTVASVVFVASVAAGLAQSAPAPTRVVRYVPGDGAQPLWLENVKDGSCWTTSIAASYRANAFRCMVGNAIYDPCFDVGGSPHGTSALVCDADPRKPQSGLVVKHTGPLPKAAPEQPNGAPWFFELADGSACQIYTGALDQIEGQSVMYGCKFHDPAESDNVLLGSLDTSSAVWTAQKASLNKKVTPRTIKSLTVVTVKTAWR